MVQIEVSEKTYECLMTRLKKREGPDGLLYTAPYTDEQIEHVISAPWKVEDWHTLDDVIRNLLEVAHSEGL